MDQAAEAAAAAAGGVFSAGALFPLEVIKTNIQAHTRKEKPGSPAADEGASVKENSNEVLCRATGEKDVHRNEEFLNFGEEKRPRDADGEESKGQTTAMPVNREPSVGTVARDIYDREGVRGFYGGVGYALGQSGIEKAAYFYGYGWLKTLALRLGGKREISTSTDVALGYFAEACHLPVTIPIEVVLTKIVTSTERTNACAVIQAILAESGLAGFYRGVQAYAVLCLKPAIQYAVFNRLKMLTLAWRRDNARGIRVTELSAAEAFVIGAVSRAVATIVVFPYIRAKVIMMSRNEVGRSSTMSPSIFASLRTIFKDDGVSALFQGITPEITRGVLSAALMLMVKEKIHSAVKGALARRSM